MELRTLRAFVEVIRQGGFSPAAKVIAATQSTVSKAVKQLEDEVGVPLLDRIGHHSTPTAAGNIVYRRALKILAERDDLITELDELRGLKRGLLRLGLPPVGSSTLFAPLFATYRGRYPGIEIRLVEQGSARLEEMLLAGDLDLAVSLLPVSDAFEWQEVRREPLVALVPAGDPLADRSTIAFAELKDHPFILFEKGFALNRVVVETCRQQAIEPAMAARSTQIDFMVELVAARLGVAILPLMIAEQQRQPLVRHVAVTEPAMEWHVAMIWRHGGYLSHAAEAWLAMLSQARAAG